MAEIAEKSGKGGKGKQKKVSIHLDFTPMVDMNMLLITFFMLCTSLSKPQTMEISMPSKDKVSEEEQTKVKASNAITLILAGKDKVYYYTGLPNYSDPGTLLETTYKADGLRALLLKRNSAVMVRMRDLKRDKLKLKITQADFEDKAREIKGDKSAPVVIIKPTDESNYKNLVDALDEMQICNIARYAIVPLADGDRFLLQSKKPAL